MQNKCKRFLLLSLFALLVSASQFAYANPEKKVIEIPMRDGVFLSTDLYFPENSNEKSPCILVRTPGPTTFRKIYQRMCDWGYVVALQSLRSLHHSDNHPEPYFADAWGELQDGYDTINWLGKSEYTNGQVGTFGESANGITQLLLAPTHPEHLKCQYIEVATPSLFQHAAYVGGKFCKHQIESWFAKIAPKAFDNILKNNTYSQYWEQIDASKKAADVQTPAIHTGGWYDLFSQGTLDSFTAWQNKGASGARGKQKLIMGPWTHWGSRQESWGEFNFPKEVFAFEQKLLMRDWFDAYLKGEVEKLEKYPNVLYFVMGPVDGSPSKGNRWQACDQWPPQCEKQTLYLTKSHRLDFNQPAYSTRKYSYSYDPKNPVPTRGGRNLYLESGPFDQRINEVRDDVITFTTEPLKEDLEVTGRVSACLYLSSDAPSTDLALTLTDVYPDGKSLLITEGIKNVAIDSNSPQKVEVDLWSTSFVFAKGHQIRLVVTSSNFPHFDINPNSAHNEVHVGLKYPSHVTLPIIED